MLVLAKSSKSELISKIVMGFGLLCFGITILGSSVEQIVSLVDLSGLFHSINNPMLYFLICLALTMIMQSGYPVIVLLVSFVGLGLVDAETACYGILGVSLGSTLAVSILVAAIGEGNNGKRIVAFNILHKIVFTIIIGLLMLIPGWVNYLHESICGGIASISLIVFDIFICFVPIILIPFSRQLASLMQIIIRDKKSSNKNGYSSFELDEKTLNNPVVAYSKLRLNIQRIISLLQDINKKNHNELFETDQYSSQKNKIKAVEKLIRLTNNNLISIAGKFVGEDKNKINTLIDIMPNLQRLVKISTKIDELSLKKAEIQKDMHSETYKFLSSYSTQILDFADGVQKLIDESVSKQEKNNELKILFATNDIMVKERNKSKKKIATNSNLNKNNVYYFNIIYELESMQQDYFDITIKTMLLED